MTTRSFINQNHDIGPADAHEFILLADASNHFEDVHLLLIWVTNGTITLYRFGRYQVVRESEVLEELARAYPDPEDDSREPGDEIDPLMN
jgi:hypothetical protein